MRLYGPVTIGVIASYFIAAVLAAPLPQELTSCKDTSSLYNNYSLIEVCITNKYIYTVPR